MAKCTCEVNKDVYIDCLQEERPVCEVCGGPAVVAVRDTEPDFNAINIGINAKLPCEFIHFFCEKHKRDSFHYDY